MFGEVKKAMAISKSCFQVTLVRLVSLHPGFWMKFHAIL
jgi:hypothetical protein